jgi:hypothetical protein
LDGRRPKQPAAFAVPYPLARVYAQRIAAQATAAPVAPCCVHDVLRVQLFFVAMLASARTSAPPSSHKRRAQSPGNPALWQSPPSLVKIRPRRNARRRAGAPRPPQITLQHRLASPTSSPRYDTAHSQKKHPLALSHHPPPTLRLPQRAMLSCRDCLLLPLPTTNVCIFFVVSINLKSLIYTVDLSPRGSKRRSCARCCLSCSRLLLFGHFFALCFGPLGLFEFSFPRRKPFSADAWVQGVSTTISEN